MSTPDSRPALRVLLVDDDSDHRWLERDLVNLSCPVCEVYEAGDVASARELLAVTPVDVMFLDLELPDLNGLVFLGELRERLSSSQLHIIVVTAHRPVEEVRQASMVLGADGFIEKTDDVAVLLENMKPFLSEQMRVNLTAREGAA